MAPADWLPAANRCWFAARVLDLVRSRRSPDHLAREFGPSAWPSSNRIRDLGLPYGHLEGRAHPQAVVVHDLAGRVVVSHEDWGAVDSASGRHLTLKTLEVLEGSRFEGAGRQARFQEDWAGST